MRFTTALLARLLAALFLVCSVTAAPVAVTTSRSAAVQEGAVAGARIAERDVSSSSTRAEHADAAAADAKKRQLGTAMWALKDRFLMKRLPNPEPAEPKRFTIDDFTTIAAANEKYDGLRPEGAGFVGLKQRGLPGWSRIY